MKQSIRFVLVALLLVTAALSAKAQIKVFPQFKVGDKYVYNCITKSGGVMAADATSTIVYYVSQKTADGYVIDQTMTSLKIDSKNDQMAMLMNLTQGMLEGVNVRTATDNRGQAKRIVNFDEVKKSCNNYIVKLINQFFAVSPDLSKTMNKEDLIKQSMASVNEKAMLEGITKTGTSPFYIFGKTIIDGTTDTYTNAQGLKLKRTYRVLSANKFTIKGVLDMTKEEKKDFILKKVEENSPDKLQLVKENIDMLIESGVFDIKGQEETTYELLSSKWVKAIDMTMTFIMMGQEIKTTAHVELAK